MLSLFPDYKRSYSYMSNLLLEYVQHAGWVVQNSVLKSKTSKRPSAAAEQLQAKKSKEQSSTKILDCTMRSIERSNVPSVCEIACSGFDIVQAHS
jgi:hypothetical protein